MQSNSTMHHHQAAGSANGSSAADAQQPLTLPPSPTLTNPDMILPYESERETSTPSPPFEPMQLPSPPDFRQLQDRSHAHEQSLHADRDPDQGVSDRTTNDAEIGMAVSFPSRQDNKRPSPSRNLWSLGGHQVGPPLSDIGEEDAASTSSWHERNSSVGNESPVLESSPHIESHWNRGGASGDEDGCDGWSDDSSSTVSAHSNNRRRWNGFDGSNVEQNGDLHSRSDQGQTEPHRDTTHDEDYKHYRRDQEEHESSHPGSEGFEHSEKENSMGSIPEEKSEEESMDEISSSLLSNEAERILENAKKRLTFMEGNLSRARTSIRMSPSPSPSPVNGSLPLGAPQPVGGLYRSISQSDRRVQTGQAGSRLRLNRTSTLSREVGNNQAHARGSSETHLPSTLQSSLPAPENRHVFRSMSAMGSTGSLSHLGDNDNSHYRDSARYSTHSRTLGSFSYQHQPLGALQEDDGQQQFESPEQQVYQPSRESTPEAHHATGNSSQNDVPKISTTEEFNSVYPSSSPPSRTHSQLHVRDLQDQMLGLKTKLSSLKVRTEEDSLRRRSLQSLRTPSPFTAADPEQWYTGAAEYRNGNSLNANAGYGFSPQLAQGGFGEEQGRSDEGPDSAREALENKHHSNHSWGADDEHSIMESHYEDAEENYSDEPSDSPLKESDRAALDEILNESEDESLYDEFHEASADAAEPTRHEDREDAFDYEHFFLHSALGNYYSRTQGRRESCSSTGSAETTRPSEQPESYSSPTPNQTANNRLSKGHTRNPSTDSVSTIATFATATEGAGSDDEDSEGEIDNALNWNGNGNSHAYSTNQTWPMQNNYLVPHSYQAPNGSGDRYADSESSTSTGETETGISTPRAQRQSRDIEDDVGLRENRVTQILAPVETGKENTGPTSSLVSSLVSSVSSSPARSKTPGESSSMQLNNDDTMALEQLFKSLGNVCLALQESTEQNGNPKVDMGTATILRRRLDAARRVLDGELDP